MKERDDLKLSIVSYQNITDDKPKDTENSIDKTKKHLEEKLRNKKKITMILTIHQQL